MKSFKQKLKAFALNPFLGMRKVFDYYVFQWLPFRLIIKFIQVNRVFKKRGFFKSVIELMPVDGSGKPVPWFTYSATEYLKQFDLSDRSVFEFGAGNSSLFFAERAREVVSVDIDKKWFKIMSENKPENLELIYAATEEEYVASISTVQSKFDIILVDGSCRFECIKAAVPHVKDGGMIILDNSDWYPKTSKFLRENNFIEVDFSDMGPQNGFAWVTSVYLRRDFNFQPLNRKQPHFAIGGTEGLVD